LLTDSVNASIARCCAFTDTEEIGRGHPTFEYVEGRRKYNILFILSLFSEYSNLESEHICAGACERFARTLLSRLPYGVAYWVNPRLEVRVKPK